MKKRMAPGEDGLKPIHMYLNTVQYGATRPTARHNAAPIRSPLRLNADEVMGIHNTQNAADDLAEPGRR